MTDHRRPYVGEGADGARRSARIDLEESDVLGWDDPRRTELIDSAGRWEEQAFEIEEESHRRYALLFLCIAMIAGSLFIIAAVTRNYPIAAVLLIVTLDAIHRSTR